MTADATYALKSGHTAEHGTGYAVVAISDCLKVDLVSVARNWNHLLDADKAIYAQPECLADLQVGQLAWVASMGTFRFGVIVKVAKSRATVAFTTATSVDNSQKYSSAVRIFEKAESLVNLRVAKVPAVEEPTVSEPDEAAPVRANFRDHGKPEAGLFFGLEKSATSVGRLVKLTQVGMGLRIADAETGEPIEGCGITAKFWLAPVPAAEHATAAQERNMAGWAALAAAYDVEKAHAEALTEDAARTPAESHDTREAWLVSAVDKLKPLFAEVDKEIPTVRLSVGWPGGRGKKNLTIGECWPTVLAADEVAQVFISPVLDEAALVLATLAHELVHVVDDCKSGHKKPFAVIAKGIGLTGKMTATVAGDELKRRLAAIAAQLGTYPHAKLTRVVPGPGGKTKGNRNLKVECRACGYTARTTKKWLEEVGAPLCPCNREEMEIA